MHMASKLESWLLNISEISKTLKNRCKQWQIIIPLFYENFVTFLICLEVRKPFFSNLAVISNRHLRPRHFGCSMSRRLEMLPASFKRFRDCWNRRFHHKAPLYVPKNCMGTTLRTNIAFGNSKSFLLCMYSNKKYFHLWFINFFPVIFQETGSQ